MSFNLKKYDSTSFETWNEICSCSVNGTFIQTMKFLSYHGNKFEDKSLMIYKDNICIGVFPAACDPNKSKYISSHPGTTFGGFVHIGKIKGNEMTEIFNILRKYYLSEGFENIIYKPTPYFYHQNPSQEDIYALHKLNAKRYRCDMSSTLDLEKELNFSSRRKRGLKKAKNNNIQISENFKYISEYWEILKENLKEKHNTNPVHNIKEINDLYKKFPENIKGIFALDRDKITGGVILFIHKNVIHAQYIASSNQGKTNSALDYVFDYAIRKFQLTNIKWFDFGISTENEGKYLNEGLYNFKKEFGSGSTIYEFYDWTL